MAAPPMIDAPRGKAPFYPYPEDVEVIGVDTPHKEGEHPLWDARCFRPLDEAMVLNIMALGVRQAIEVEPTPDRKARVIDGRRRVLHAREANKRLVAMGQPRIQIPVMAEKGSEIEALLRMVSLNEHRLEETVTSRARKAAMMIKRNVPIEQVALSFGKSTQTIRNWQALADLPDDLVQAVDNGIVSPTTALALASKPQEERDSFLAAPDAEAISVLDALSTTPDDTTATTEDVAPAVSKKEKKKKAKKAEKMAKTSKKKTINAAKGVRGKKFFKLLSDDFHPYLPEEFLLGVRFAHGMITDDQLPPKVRTQVTGALAIYGEIDPENLPVGIARQLKKMYTSDDG